MKRESRLVFKSANLKRLALILGVLVLVFQLVQQSKDVGNILGIPPIILMVIIIGIFALYSGNSGRGES